MTHYFQDVRIEKRKSKQVGKKCKGGGGDGEGKAPSPVLLPAKFWCTSETRKDFRTNYLPTKFQSTMI